MAGMIYDPEKARAYRLMREYGLTLAEYDAILRAQGGKCAICRKAPRQGKRLAVDHNHKTGAIRGLLCYFDNSQRLGRGNEDPEIHGRLADYLRHGAERVAEIRSALDGG